MNNSDEYFENLISKVVKKTMHDEMKVFYVDRETHYQDHQFIKEVREFLQNIRNSTLLTTIRVVVPAIIGAFALGIVYLIKKYHS